MWTCHNCENTNENESHICDVCGAAYPDVVLSWKNKDGKDASFGGKAILSWDAYYCRSAFAIYGGKSYYLTDKKSVEFPIFDEPKTGTIYFCSSGGYIKNEFKIGNVSPAIEVFSISPLKSEYRYADNVWVSWKVKNGFAVLFDGSKSETLFGTNGSKMMTVREAKKMTLSVVGDTETIKSDPISIKVAKPILPKIISKTVVTKDPKIKEEVEIRIMTSGCDSMRYSLSGTSEMDRPASKRYMPDGNQEFTIKVYPRLESNQISLSLYGTGFGDGATYSDERDFTAHDYIYFEATPKKGEVLNISHSDTYIKKGGKFVVNWKTENITGVQIGIKSTGGCVMDYRGKPTVYGANGEATISNIQYDDTIYLMFMQECGDPIVRSIDIHCKRFIGLYKKFHKGK